MLRNEHIIAYATLPDEGGMVLLPVNLSAHLYSAGLARLSTPLLGRLISP